MEKIRKALEEASKQAQLLYVDPNAEFEVRVRAGQVRAQLTRLLKSL